MALRITRLALRSVALLCAGVCSAGAQQQPGPQQSVPSAQALQAQPSPGVPDTFKLNLMIRTAIIALNQANQTGNYTVLRDLGAVPFRESNDPSRLAEIFAALRKRQLDLSPIIFFTPKIVQQPQIDQRGLLRLVGYFPTTPEQVNFDIYYAQENGQWRLFGIGVITAPAETTSAVPEQGPAPQSPKNETDQPAAAATKPAQPQPPAKPAASAKPAAKPDTSARASGAQPMAAPAAKPDKSAVQNKAAPDGARVDLAVPGNASVLPPPAAAADGWAVAPEPAKPKEPDFVFPF